jgi:hypothetical protein
VLLSGARQRVRYQGGRPTSQGAGDCACTASAGTHAGRQGAGGSSSSGGSSRRSDRRGGGQCPSEYREEGRGGCRKGRPCGQVRRGGEEAAEAAEGASTMAAAAAQAALLLLQSREAHLVTRPNPQTTPHHWHMDRVSRECNIVPPSPLQALPSSHRQQPPRCTATAMIHSSRSCCFPSALSSTPRP